MIATPTQPLCYATQASSTMSPFRLRLAVTYILDSALLARARFYAGALALREALARRERSYTSGAFQTTHFAKNREE